ncbi:DUF3352 domain-containing protein [Anaerolineales bacterium HSG6]|nr:DUF3352 domain-containing protein [Anaerolineales bacterium HSG6]MDM8530117.1 DUF3352 domain-containing protein [Anaerolineales bacterium HSG25]
MKKIGGGVVALLVLACVALVGIGGGMTYMYQDDFQAVMGTKQSQKTAQLLPEETQLYMAFTPNVQAISGYENLKALYLDNPEIKAILDNAEKEILIEGDSQVNIREDILPWLGTEVVIAMPHFADAVAEETDDAPDVIISMQSRDLSASNTFVENEVNNTKGEPFVSEEYQGVTLNTQPQTNNEYDEMTIATVDDLVIMSSNKDFIKSMIDKAKGSDTKSLVDNPNYAKIVSEMPTNGISIMYIEISGMMDTILAEADMPLPPDIAQNMQAFKAVAMTGLLEADGILFNMIVNFDVDMLSEDMKAAMKQEPSSNNILMHIPADALFSMNSLSLQRVWEQTKISLEANPDFAETMTDFEQELGLNIDEDIFSWMTGEYAFVGVEAEPIDEYSPPVGGYMLIGSTDVGDAQTKVQKIVDVMLEQTGGFIEFEPATVQGIEVNSAVMQSFDPDSAGEPTGAYYGFHNDYFISAYPEDAVKALGNASQNSLADDASFKAIQPRLPSNNSGYIYFNFDKLRPMVEENMSPGENAEYDETVRPFLEPVHIMVVSNSTEGLEDGVAKGSIFFLITE